MLRINDDIFHRRLGTERTVCPRLRPGGQNVNKVATAVELRFEAARSPSLPGPVKTRLKRLAGRRWTTEGALIIQCDETRSQARNRDIARQRLVDSDPQSSGCTQAAHRDKTHIGIKKTPAQGQEGPRRRQGFARQGGSGGVTSGSSRPR